MSAAVIPDEETCVQCNYALRGLSEFRCPECGRAFDPARPLTMNLGRRPGPFARAALRPMGRLPRVAMWMLVVAGVVGPAWLVPDEQLACFWLVLWLAFFIACWLRSFVRVLVVRLYRQPRVLLRLDDPFRWKARAAFVITTLLVLTRLPFLLAILVSRSWLDPYAYHVWAEIPATTTLPDGPVVRGLIVIRSVDARGGGVAFDFYGGGSIDYVPAEDGQKLRVRWWGWNPRIAELWRDLTGA